MRIYIVEFNHAALCGEIHYVEADSKCEALRKSLKRLASLDIDDELDGNLNVKVAMLVEYGDIIV